MFINSSCTNEPVLYRVCRGTHPGFALRGERVHALSLAVLPPLLWQHSWCCGYPRGIYQQNAEHPQCFIHVFCISLCPVRGVNPHPLLKTLFCLGSVLGGCWHTRKTDAAWAGTGVNDSSRKTGFAPGGQGVHPYQTCPVLGVGHQSLKEDWRPAGCWGGSVLQHTKVATTIKEEKLGQLLRLLASSPVCSHVEVQSWYAAQERAPKLARQAVLHGDWHCSCLRAEGFALLRGQRSHSGCVHTVVVSCLLAQKKEEPQSTSDVSLPVSATRPGTHSHEVPQRHFVLTRDTAWRSTVVQQWSPKAVK